MARRRNAQAEQSLCMRLLEYSDECVAKLRSTLAECIERASHNAADSFAPLGNLCLQLANRVNGGVATSTPGNAADTNASLPSAVDLCFTYRGPQDLVRKLNAAAQATSRWRPVEQLSQERPSIVLGDREETIERWKQDAEEAKSQSDRVTEQKRRQSIVKAMDAVFAAIALHQSSIRDRLRSGEREPGQSRGWTQSELDESIRQLRGNDAAGIESLRRRICQGDQSALRDARQHYGRNALARRLEAPGAMITRSTEWQDLADHLGLPRGRRSARGSSVGFDIAVEDASVARHDRAESVASMLYQLQERVPGEILDSVREQLAMGAITDEQALQCLRSYLESGENDGGNDDRS
jgi:hypothetical protein